MDNKKVKARLRKAPVVGIKLPPEIGKWPRAEHIWLSKKQTKSSRSNKVKNFLTTKRTEQQQQQSKQQQQQSEKLERQNEQQHQPTYDTDLSEDGRVEQKALMEIKRVQSELSKN